MPYLKLYNRLVSYQKSEKSNDWLPRNAQKCLFFTPISPFLAKNFFFSKFRFHQSLGAVKSYLDTKNQKILMSRSSGISRTDRLTDKLTDEGKSIGPYLIGRSKKGDSIFKTYSRNTERFLKHLKPA